MWQQFLIAVVIIAASYYYWVKVRRSPQKPTVEILKNALLTFALSHLRRADIDYLNMNYAAFDGSKLPMMSGYDLNNTLCTYIITKEDLRNGPFYTKIMEDKLTAIDKYLATQFDTHEKVEAFLTAFVEQVTPTPPPPVKKMTT